MPFFFPWTDAPPGRLARNTAAYHWGKRSTFAPDDFCLDLAVLLDGRSMLVPEVTDDMLAASARDDVTAHVGLILSGDTFYNPRPELTAPLVAHGVLAVELEASALYTLAASYGRQALAVCTVSDHIVTGEETTSAEREQTFGAMVEIALGAALAQT